MATPTYGPGVEPPFPPDIEPRSGRVTRPERHQPSDASFWIAVVLGAVVILGLVYWFTANPRLWTTASNTTTTTTQNPPIPQPPPGTQQPPPTKP